MKVYKRIVYQKREVFGSSEPDALVHFDPDERKILLVGLNTTLSISVSRDWTDSREYAYLGLKSRPLLEQLNGSDAD